MKLTKIESRRNKKINLNKNNSHIDNMHEISLEDLKEESNDPVAVFFTEAHKIIKKYEYQFIMKETIEACRADMEELHNNFKKENPDLEIDYEVYFNDLERLVFQVNKIRIVFRSDYNNKNSIVIKTVDTMDWLSNYDTKYKNRNHDYYEKQKSDTNRYYKTLADLQTNFHFTSEAVLNLMTQTDRVYDVNLHDLDIDLFMAGFPTDREKLRSGPFIITMKRVFEECEKNPWYFFKHLATLNDANNTQTQTRAPFVFNEVNITMLWTYFNDISSIIYGRRQSGKSLTYAFIIYYEVFIRGNYNILYYNINKMQKEAFIKTLDNIIKNNEWYMRHNDSYHKRMSKYKEFKNHLREVQTEEVTKTGRNFIIPKSSSFIVDDLEFYVEDSVKKNNFITESIKGFLLNGCKGIKFSGCSTINRNLNQDMVFLLDSVLIQIEGQNLYRIYDPKWMNNIREASCNKPIGIYIHGDEMSDGEEAEHMYRSYMSNKEDIINSEFYIKR